MSRADRIPQGDEPDEDIGGPWVDPMPFVQRWSMGWSVEPYLAAIDKECVDLNRECGLPDDWQPLSVREAKRKAALFDDNPNIVRGEE